MKCPTCSYEFEPRNPPTCPRCGESFSCSSLSCGDCGACPSMMASVRTMYAKLTDGTDSGPPSPGDVEQPSE